MIPQFDLKIIKILIQRMYHHIKYSVVKCICFLYNRAGELNYAITNFQSLKLDSESSRLILDSKLCHPPPPPPFFEREKKI